MSFDGTITRALVFELNRDYKGGKIDKVYQTEKDELVLQIRCGSNRGNLVISSSANNPRMYITNEKKRNPTSPPAFCMLLRKHLESSTILSFQQLEMDRIIKIHLSTTNELFDQVEKSLVVEIMGRHSNIILIHEESQIIIDSIKRVNQSLSRVRQVLPGLIYSTQEIINKKNPLQVTEESFYQDLELTDQGKIKDFFIQTYMGLSPLIAREIHFRSDLPSTPIGSLSQKDKEDLYLAFKSIIEDLNQERYRPNQVLDDDRTIAFSCIELRQYPKKDIEYFDTISQLLDKVYSNKDLKERIQQKTQNIQKLVKIQLDRTLKKQEKMELELREAKDRRIYKIYGDVLSANSWAVHRGDPEVTLENFYDDMNPITIPLDIKKDAIQNAAFFYKKYSKLKHAENTINVQLKKTRSQIQYLDSLLYHIESCQSIDEIDEVQEEFRVEFLKKRSDPKKKGNKKQDKFLTYRTQDESLILVGRNNRENAELTLKVAKNNDLWFHVKNGPGSHVILRVEGEKPSEQSIIEAAHLAAYYSRQKNSENVEVDFTQRRNVKRHPSNQLGLVTYTDFKTLYITPHTPSLKLLEEK